MCVCERERKRENDVYVIVISHYQYHEVACNDQRLNSMAI